MSVCPESSKFVLFDCGQVEAPSLEQALLSTLPRALLSTHPRAILSTLPRAISGHAPPEHGTLPRARSPGLFVWACFLVRFWITLPQNNLQQRFPWAIWSTLPRNMCAHANVNNKMLIGAWQIGACSKLRDAVWPKLLDVGVIRLLDVGVIRLLDVVWSKWLVGVWSTWLGGVWPNWLGESVIALARREV